MLQLSHSPFLQALGYTILNSLWQFALLWLLYVVINSLFAASSNKKYVMASALQLVGFIWFCFTLFFYYNQCLDTVVTGQKIPFPIDESSSPLDVLRYWVARGEVLLPYLSAIYLLLFVYTGGRWFSIYRHTQKLRTEGISKIEVNWRLFVQSLAGQMGIKRPVNIYLSRFINTPLTLGFFKPLILIPLATINHLDQRQMEAVILHEMAHIKRFDYFCNLLSAVIETVLFFNPFMKLLNKEISRERENCCDDWVLQYDYNASSYAYALLNIASVDNGSRVLALKAADDKQLLLNRIKRMVEKQDKHLFNYNYQVAALCAMTMIFGFLLVFTPAAKHQYSLNGAPETGNTAGSAVAPVDNAPFRPVLLLSEEKIVERTSPGLNSDKTPVKTINVSSNVSTFHLRPQPRRTLMLATKKSATELAAPPPPISVLEPPPPPPPAFPIPVQYNFYDPGTDVNTSEDIKKENEEDAGRDKKIIRLGVLATPHFFPAQAEAGKELQRFSRVNIIRVQGELKKLSRQIKTKLNTQVDEITDDRQGMATRQRLIILSRQVQKLQMLVDLQIATAAGQPLIFNIEDHQDDEEKATEDAIKYQYHMSPQAPGTSRPSGKKEARAIKAGNSNDVNVPEPAAKPKALTFKSSYIIRI